MGRHSFESESATVHAKRKLNIIIPIAIVFYFLGGNINNNLYKEENNSPISVHQSFHHKKQPVCDSFTRLYDDDNESGGCGVLTALRFTEGGRLGNMITKSAKMISYAIEHIADLNFR